MSEGEKTSLQISYIQALSWFATSQAEFLNGNEVTEVATHRLLQVANIDLAFYI